MTPGQEPEPCEQSTSLARDRKGQGDAVDMLAFVTGVALSVPLSRWAEEYHYVFLLPALALVAHILMRTRGATWAWRGVAAGRASSADASSL